MFWRTPSRRDISPLLVTSSPTGSAWLAGSAAARPQTEARAMAMINERISPF
jgi:hypothetical protein